MDVALTAHTHYPVPCLPSLCQSVSFPHHTHKHSNRMLDSPLFPLRCTIKPNPSTKSLKTCKNCKTQFDPSLNHRLACRFHPAHFGGETKRKFESVYSGGTLDTPDSGQVFQYWHCCGSEDPFDPGCTSSPHSSYDD